MNTPSKNCQTSRASENSDPNIIIISTPSTKSMLRSPPPPLKPTTTRTKTTTPLTGKTPRRRQPSPPKDRKFIVARKIKKQDPDHAKKSRESAYEALRASQEGFFRRDPPTKPSNGAAEPPNCNDGDGISAKAAAAEEEEDIEDPPSAADQGTLDLRSRLRKIRSLVMEEALSSVPEQGSGRVNHLVKAFESLLLISNDEDEAEDGRRKVMTWALPGQQQPLIKRSVVHDDGGDHGGSPLSTSLVSEFFPSKDFERDSRVYSSLDSNERWSFGSRTSSGRRKSRRHSADSSRKSWSKKLRVTSQQPFKLRTEQRGWLKEEHFIQKVKEMLVEEERKRIPIAQGLPWTTDEPECLVRPPVKERTEPIDIVLHSDVRAVERAEFDHYVSERLSFAEDMKSERDRQRKLEEEEEIRRLRRELVPRAQPIPFFDRPFVPKKSTRLRTVPKEPRFHVRPPLKTW